MSFEIALDVAERGEYGVIDDTELCPDGVQQGCRVSFAEDEAIVGHRSWIVRIEAHHVEEDRRDEISGRGRAGRMSAARGGRRADRVNAKPCRDVFQGVKATFGGNARSYARLQDFQVLSCTRS